MRRNGDAVSGCAITAHIGSLWAKAAERSPGLQILVDVASSPPSKILPGAHKNFANVLHMATPMALWAERDKEMVIFINPIFLPFLRLLLAVLLLGQRGSMSGPYE
jgi:hypothetical protein